jgi:CheY-like chemotaxis protein
MEKMNGAISVDSTPGEGSVFTVDVELPRPAELESGTAFDADLAGKKILVVDSDQRTQDQFMLLAEKARFHVESVTDGDDALSRITSSQKANKPYDAIFADNAHAASLAEKLPSGTDIRTLILMAMPQQWNKLEMKPHSAIRHFLAKPLFPSTIAKSIREATTVTDADGSAAAAHKDAVPDFSQVSLLLAEDVYMNREIFTSLLEPTKVRIDTAENGREALEKFRSAPDSYDIIIMDILMPVMDGYEATKAIRELDIEKARSIPIIAMTANVFKSDIEKCLDCGMNGHLPKPIDIKAVIETIRSYCVK